MVKIFPKMLFTERRHRTPWQKELGQIQQQTAKEKGTLTPPFVPRDGVYTYARNFDYKGQNRKGSTYRATLRISFSPAPDYGWQIAGVGAERLSVRGIEGGEPRKIIVDDGRVTANGKFYWKEVREKGMEIVIFGSMEPRYHLSNGYFTIDDSTKFQAYHKVSSSVNQGHKDVHKLEDFYRRGDLETKALSFCQRTQPPEQVGQTKTSRKKSTDPTKVLQEAFRALALDDASSTEEYTEGRESFSAGEPPVPFDCIA